MENENLSEKIQLKHAKYHKLKNMSPSGTNFPQEYHLIHTKLKSSKNSGKDIQTVYFLIYIRIFSKS